MRIKYKRYGRKRAEPIRPKFMLYFLGSVFTMIVSLLSCDLLHVEAASLDDIQITMDVEINLSLDKSNPSNKKLYGEGNVYVTSEDAASHRFVSASLPNSYVMSTPKGEKYAPDGTTVVFDASLNARKGYFNHEALNGLNGKTSSDLSVGKVKVTIPFTNIFVQYGVGEYSMSIPITLTMSKAYGSYSDALDFTPWDELVSSEEITVSDGKVIKVEKSDAILEIDPSVTELTSNLFRYSTYTELVIPPSVTSASKACYSSKVETVIFEDGFTEIPKEICYYAKNLRTASIPNEVTKIGDGAFDNCIALTDFKFPDALESLGASSFRNCTELGELTVYRNIPKSTSLGITSPFYQAGLKRITFVEGVTEIPPYFCYEGCKQLTELNLPSTLEKIGSDAFTNAKLLEELTIKSNVVNGSSSTSPFKGSGLKTLTFEDGVTTIAASLFRDGCASVTELNIPDTVKNIGGNAFTNATSLKEFTLKNDVSLSGTVSPFKGSGIETINITEDVTSIPNYMFDSGCSHIKELDFPPTLTYVGPDAFRGATSLDKVTVRSDLNESIAVGTVVGPFRDADIREVMIAEGVTNIPRYFFAEGCNSLTNISFPSTIKTLDSHAFYGCTSYDSLDIPASMERLGPNAFGNATALKTVRVNSNLTANPGSGTISAFTNAGIGTVIISEGVTEIPRGLFENGVANLTDLRMPSSLTSIGGHSFGGCSSLAELDFSENISFLGYNAFHDATSLKKVTIRSDISVESGGLSYVFENAGIEQIVVADGVTKIPSYLFQHGIASLTELSLPDTLTEIGVHSFSGCSVLRNLDIPASVNKIGIYAFEDATSLKSLRMKNSWRFSSFASPFEGSGIEILTVDDGIAKVPGYLLSNGCEHLTDVYLPASVATVENSAFAGCGNVTCHFAGTESEWANVALGNWTPAMVICSDTTLMGMARAEVDESADALISDLKDEAELTENSEENNKEESDTDTVGDTETEEPIAGEEGASNEDETISDDDPNDENDVATNNDIPEETEDEDSDIVHIDADINQEENQFEITEENSDDSDGDPPEEEPFSSEDAITSKKHDEDGEEDEGG